MEAQFDQLSLQVLFGLFQLVILAFLIERGLYFVFDYRIWREKIAEKGIRAPIALAVSWFICWHHSFDIVARTLDFEGETQIGIFITATIVAGGSSAVMLLFNDVLKFTRSAREKMKETA